MAANTANEQHGNESNDEPDDGNGNDVMDIYISNDDVSRTSEVYEFVNNNLCKGSPIIEEIIDILKEEKNGRVFDDWC